MASLDRDGGIGIILVILILLLAIAFTPLLIQEVNAEKATVEYTDNFTDFPQGDTFNMTGTDDLFYLKDVRTGVFTGEKQATVAFYNNYTAYVNGNTDTSTILGEGGAQNVTINGTAYTMDLTNINTNQDTITGNITYEAPEKETTTSTSTSTSTSTTIMKTLSEKSKAVWNSVPILFVVACLLAIAVFWRDR